MAFPVVPVLLGAGVVALLALLSAGDRAGRDQPLPDTPDPPAPDDVPPPIPNQFDTGLTGMVIAPSGLKLRAQPTQNSGQVGSVPYRERVLLLEQDTRPPSVGDNGFGWWRVRTQRGQEGFVSAEFVCFGTDRECTMTDEEAKRYHEERQDRPRPIYTLSARQPRIAGTGVSWSSDPSRGSGSSRCVAPNGCFLRTGPDDRTISSFVVPNGAPLQILQRVPGTKRELASPSLGGWSMVRFFDRATNRTMTGWLPSEWIV